MDILLDNLPGLLIAIPLLGAFLTPFLSRAGDSVRNAWILLIAALSSLCGLLVASRVLETGTIVYAFGVDAISHGIPPIPEASPSGSSLR